VTVFRGQHGTEQEILVSDLVVGDVIDVFQGDIVPADCILIEEMNIKVDESIYGTIADVEKEPSAHWIENNQGQDVTRDNHEDLSVDNLLLTGSLVMSGGGKAVVCCVGENTFLSRSRDRQDKLVIEEQKTTLEEKLEESCLQITKYCEFATTMIVIAQLVNLFMMICLGNNKDSVVSAATLERCVKIGIIAICILIVAIPEGMALAVSIAMALSIT
jgi:magnesium-transporting ATPase (P-type)